MKKIDKEFANILSSLDKKIDFINKSKSELLSFKDNIANLDFIEMNIDIDENEDDFIYIEGEFDLNNKSGPMVTDLNMFVDQAIDLEFYEFYNFINEFKIEKDILDKNNFILMAEPLIDFNNVIKNYFDINIYTNKRIPILEYSKTGRIIKIFDFEKFFKHLKMNSVITKVYEKIIAFRAYHNYRSVKLKVTKTTKKPDYFNSRLTLL